MAGKNDVPVKLLWIDLEMTGLDPAVQRIIEVALIVTDFQLNEIASYEAVIHHADSVFENAEQWPKEHMQQLFEASKNADKDEEVVKGELEAFIEKHFGSEPVVLAGNSIHQDRRFIRQWWPGVEARLHYRMMDVSSFKIWVQGTTEEQYMKQERHRAMDDIRESIAELRWSLERV